ncbi:MAG TPA: pectate lyase [Chryseolinea sp.]|nr:pectate lyase [Chryseolinea sp.]HPH47091.1 pectate lyase [Chryseolinea sp.]HPM31172.1 pectate lyase [Chryseolinea sp.]
MKYVVIVFLIKMFFLSEAQEKVLAFPGAEGFGKYSSGGRGGKVFIVSNLNDDGPGSLREAIKKKEARIIVFSVSGTIELQSPLFINYGDLTIAGQTAPGDGICLRNYSFNINADNVIVRFMRFRLGDTSKEESDALGGNKGKSNIIIDHCSISWSTDECASFYRNKNFTMQWCIVSESLSQSVHTKGKHGYGGIWGGEGATFHHNLLAHHTSRLPRLSGSSTTPNGPDELVDFRNNVIYNWESNSTYGGERGRYNMVNNYYKPGPATKSKNEWMLNAWSPYGQFYLNGNCLVGNTLATKDNWKAGGVKADNPDSARVDKPFVVESIIEQNAETAFDLVLKRSGASLKRDAIDARVVKEVKSGTAIYGKNKDGIIDSQQDVGGWPELKSLPPEKDSDSDGMPDSWEVKNKLNANSDDAIAHTLNRHYDNIEVYFNSIVDSVMSIK